MEGKSPVAGYEAGLAPARWPGTWAIAWGRSLGHQALQPRGQGLQPRGLPISLIRWLLAPKLNTEHLSAGGPAKLRQQQEAPTLARVTTPPESNPHGGIPHRDLDCMGCTLEAYPCSYTTATWKPTSVHLLGGR